MRTAETSICIPAYRNPAEVERLLLSVLAQRYRDYEVCLSDDTPGDEVAAVAERLKARFADGRLHYVHNGAPLGHARDVSMSSCESSRPDMVPSSSS